MLVTIRWHGTQCFEEKDGHTPLALIYVRRIEVTVSLNATSQPCPHVNQSHDTSIMKGVNRPLPVVSPVVHRHTDEENKRTSIQYSQSSRVAEVL
ncbi:hypothetical protein HBI56_171210 [Parastagonospora nodorum]|uniref:Uncharacterized protein n=1 Tax=Phaeosphaeria nodorum (strain SN15 / ATCC MYA-4574 / FGSC 10173) TaxID=321614 RepID=A0A7U2F5U7_PHANO|nr:hypothetical protein HBH56_234030 [Parastagonospora nodorum]QRC97055.1 hypothetical protein JI435_410000 [Parastagonospora nodorum SN15]KAH3921358.1 hypothetical protein HBH54_242090 [Parastagonospora nodorum]KAH3944548.1 hypothetical protein HBH53_158160 [Parastagonospora nodorum]KAH3959394.1 hypothetical protein HBH52_244960 [Parastagonospora nodorum]